MSEPIRHLDTAVQSALIADDPQQAVTDLVKRYAAQMAGALWALTAYQPTVDNCDSPILEPWSKPGEHLEDIQPEPVYLERDVTRILNEWAKA